MDAFLNANDDVDTWSDTLSCNLPSTDDLEEELEVDLCLLDYLWRSENVFAQVLINHEFNFSAKQGSHAHLIV